ncbi:MAG: hypothetical protein AAGA50_12955 [Pseudomonadota bacterium]
MMQRPIFSDEQLTAYLDGETDHVPAEEIRAALENDPDLRSRLEGLSLETGQIADAFDQLLHHTPEMPVLADVSPPEATRSGLFSLRQVAAIAAVVLFLGLGVGYLAPHDTPRTWHDFVATYHALYVTDTLAHIEQSEAAAAVELAQAAKAVGKSIDLQILTNIEQLDYKRAQILGFENSPLLQLTFLSNSNEPIALCIIRARDAGEEELQLAQMQNMSAAFWSRDGFDFLLVGGNDDSLIKSVAESLVTRL